jgi:hypothetical protein
MLQKCQGKSYRYKKKLCDIGEIVESDSLSGDTESGTTIESQYAE